MGLNLGLFNLEFSRPRSQRPDPDAALHLVLDLLGGGRAASARGRALDDLVIVDPLLGGWIRQRLPI